MPMRNRLLSEIAAVVATIDPDVYTASTYLSDAIDMAKYDQIMGAGLVGTLGSSATITYRFVQATTSGGTYKAISPAVASTALSQAVSPDDSDKQVVLNLRAEQLDAANDFRWVKMEMVVGVANSDAGAVVFGSGARYGPAHDNDLASVAEIV